jgi:hypothetical protein
MDHPAALHRLQVGVPATVEHSSEAGPETGKWVAETTQVRSILILLAFSLALIRFVLHRCNQSIPVSSHRVLSHSWMP